MNNTLIKAVIAGAAAAIGFAMYNNYRLLKICDKLDKSVDDVARSAKVDVSPAIVKEAVDKAATQAAEREVMRVASAAVSELKSDISAKAKEEVEKQAEGYKDDVRNALETKVLELSISKIEKEVIESTKADVKARLSNDIKAILDDYNYNLRNVSKIYDSIADTLKGREDRKETVLRLG